MGKKHRTSPDMMWREITFLLAQRRTSRVCWIHKNYRRLLVCQAGLEEKGPCCKDVVVQKMYLFSNGYILLLSQKNLGFQKEDSFSSSCSNKTSFLSSPFGIFWCVHFKEKAQTDLSQSSGMFEIQSWHKSWKMLQVVKYIRSPLKKSSWLHHEDFWENLKKTLRTLLGELFFRVLEISSQS